VQFRSAARKTRTRRRGHARGDVAKSAAAVERQAREMQSAAAVER
jgi:hypothetical protein